MFDLPNLDERCSRHFTYRDFVECGTTWRRHKIANVPAKRDTYVSISRLATEILDAVVEQFGDIQLTYGFAGAELTQRIKHGIAPRLDQHASCELSLRGKQICDRGGAACDFRIPRVDSMTVAQWVVCNTPFDRLYYYGPDRPIHVSSGINAKGQIVLVNKSESSGNVRPCVVTKENFLNMKIRTTAEEPS